VILYGIASNRSGDIEDWYPTREEAEATLASILGDEPDFEGELWVEAVEFEQSLNYDVDRIRRLTASTRQAQDPLFAAAAGCGNKRPRDGVLPAKKPHTEAQGTGRER
jgi:hypothetical protein